MFFSSNNHFSSKNHHSGGGISCICYPSVWHIIVRIYVCFFYLLFYFILYFILFYFSCLFVDCRVLNLSQTEFCVCLNQFWNLSCSYRFWNHFCCSWQRALTVPQTWRRRESMSNTENKFYIPLTNPLTWRQVNFCKRQVNFCKRQVNFCKRQVNFCKRQVNFCNAVGGPRVIQLHFR